MTDPRPAPRSSAPSSYMATLGQGDTSSIWSWASTSWEMQRQVEEYDTLPVTQSYRGIAALLTASPIGLTLLLALLRVVSPDAAWGLIIYGPIAWCIYRGHRWAMVTMMILWTFEKGYTLVVRFPAGIGAIIFWLLFMKYYIGAFRVEQARRALPPSDPSLTDADPR